MAIYKPTGIKKLYHSIRRFMAKHWMAPMHGLQIGITGSQGKTSTTGVITKICESFGPTIVTDLNLDTTFNVPITALNVRPWTQFVVWELGIDHPGEMDQHLAIAHPRIGIITGISPVHTDAEHMGSLKRLVAEKRKLIESLPEDGRAVLNYDDENVRSMAPFTKARVAWYGTDPKKCDVWVDKKSIKITLEGTRAVFATRESSSEIRTKLVGFHHLYNLMAGYLVMTTIDPKRTWNTFQRVIDQLVPLRGRMNIEPGPLQTLLINDSLRANPESTYSGLKTFNEIPYKKGKKIAVIGEMGELEKPEEEHKKTGRQIAAMQFDFVVGIGPLRKYTLEEAVKNGFPKSKTAYAKDVFEAADILKKILKKDDLWYLKGSLLRNYKRIPQLLRGEEVCCDQTLCPYEHCGYGQKQETHEKENPGRYTFRRQVG